MAWVSLDTTKRPTAFWSYVLAALRRCGAVPPQNELAELTVAGPRHQEEHVRRIARGLSKLPQPVVLILDDFHHIDNPAVLRGLETLLRYPSPLRLMLLSRSDPRLPLHRLRVAGELTEVRAADLAFRESEATALFHSAGLDLTADQRRILFGRTEGWPTGLRLAALFARRPEVDRRIEDFSGDIGTVAEYLIEEVLAAQPLATRRFLLYTSVVERLCADLANALTDRSDGQRLLERLEQENAFVVAVGPHKRWFRYHPLLADLLRHQLILEDPNVVPSLHRRAAQWFGAHGVALEAVRHAVQARDWPLVGRLVITHAAPRLVSAEGPALMALLGEIPANELSATAELGTCAALLRYGARDYAALPSVVARARAQLAGRDPASRRPTEVVLRVLDIVAARAVGDLPGLIAATSDVLTWLPEIPADVMPAGPQLRALALGNRGVALLWTGETEEAETSLKRALVAAEEAKMEITELNTLGHLALLMATQCWLNDAQGRRTKRWISPNGAAGACTGKA